MRADERNAFMVAALAAGFTRQQAQFMWDWVVVLLKNGGKVK